MAARPRIRLPKQWSHHVKAGILHAISLAGVALSYARGRATGHRRLRAQLDQVHTEIALLREELAIKDARWRRSHTRRRPHYTPTQRNELSLGLTHPLPVAHDFDPRIAFSHSWTGCDYAHRIRTESRYFPRPAWMTVHNLRLHIIAPPDGKGTQCSLGGVVRDRQPPPSSR